MDPSSYPLSDIAVVVKHHTHEVRNALNGMELNLTLLEEAATTPTLQEAVKRLREAGAEIGRLTQGLFSKFGAEAPSVIPLVQIVERWSADARHVTSAVPLQWSVQLTDELVCADMGLVRGLLKDALEISVRISRKRPLQINCHCEAGFAVFEVVALGFSAITSVNNSQPAYWTALRRLAERGKILMWPESLEQGPNPRIRISIPVYQPPS